MSRYDPGSRCMLGYYTILTQGFQQDAMVKVHILPESTVPSNIHPTPIICEDALQTALVYMAIRLEAVAIPLNILKVGREYLAQINFSNGTLLHAFQIDVDYPLLIDGFIHSQYHRTFWGLLLGTNDNATCQYILIVHKILYNSANIYERVGCASLPASKRSVTTQDYFASAKAGHFQIV